MEEKYIMRIKGLMEEEYGRSGLIEVMRVEMLLFEKFYREVLPCKIKNIGNSSILGKSIVLDTYKEYADFYDRFHGKRYLSWAVVNEYEEWKKRKGEWVEKDKMEILKKVFYEEYEYGELEWLAVKYFYENYGKKIIEISEYYIENRAELEEEVRRYGKIDEDGVLKIRV